MQKRKMLVGILIAVGLSAALYWVNRSWINPGVQKGRSDQERPLAPDFSLTGLDGEEIHLADYKGKVLLINFWATWCGPCREEIPAFVDLVDRYRNEGFTILGISMDDGPDPVHKFYQEFKMNYPVGLDDARIAQLFGGVLGIPTSFLIGRDGRIYSRHIGLVPIAIIEEEIKTLLAQKDGEEVTEFRSAETGRGGAREPITLGNPQEIFSEVPGIDISQLSQERKEAFKTALAEDRCTCGCGMGLLQCRVEDSSCSVSLEMAKKKLASFASSPG